MSHRYDAAIIGAGILGLSTALELSRRFPRQSFVVMEKEPGVAAHQTGHNSGVIHSGIYYRPQSEKARLCVEGMKLMMSFCETNGIDHARTGKVIVATHESELPRLASLYERGVANGVSGLEIIGPDRLKEIEPHTQALQALYSPQTAVVDYRAVARAMERTMLSQGADILTSAKVTRIVRADGNLYLQTQRQDVCARCIVNCGGLYADAIARIMGERPDIQIIPFRGEYYTLKAQKRYLVRGLIYPVPDPTFPFLGVHLTRTIGGEVEAGPNAVLAFAREGYTMFKINLAEMLGTIGYRGFWAMVRRYWKKGAFEFYRSISKKAFLHALQRLVPSLEEGDIERGSAGVRAQAVSLDGNLVDDFRIISTPSAIHVLNAPSPAATASLAIGRHLAELVSQTLQFQK
jgi:L-2-hydroxyglutarate oxidase LhgO